MWDEKDFLQKNKDNKNNLYIKGIPKNKTARELFEYFYKFGDIFSFKLNEDDKGNNNGTAFVTYYKQDDVYQFDSSFPYYQFSNGIYTLTNVTSSIYNSLKSNLYLEKDDADSYFGMKCHEYEESTGKACLSLTLKLLVRQRNT